MKQNVQVSVKLDPESDKLLRRIEGAQANNAPDISEAFTYHAPTTDQIVAMNRLRIHALSMAKLIDGMCPEGADKEAAIRKLRECIMTANASIVLEGC